MTMRRTAALLLALMCALSILSIAVTASADLDREPPRVAQCFDGVDNDDDGLVDRRDPDCSSEFDNSEHPPDRAD
jgi:hypothetical protein